MPAFAIFRLQKHKDLASVGRASRHMDRSDMPKNADPSRVPQNRAVIGGDRAPVELVEERMGQARGPLRKNGVRAIEVLTSMSPEWAKKATKAELDAWVESNRKWLGKEFGPDNVVALHLHMDESTPHLSGFVVPVDPTTGKLNASRWLDGKMRLNQMQDSYAAAMKPHGLERGIAGGEAKYTRVKEFYGNIQTPVQTVTVPQIPLPPTFGREAWVKEQQQALQAAVDKQVRPLQDKAALGLALKRQKLDVQADAVSRRTETEAARDVPLVKVLEEAGLKPDPADKKQWRDEQGQFRISVDGRKWFDHGAHQGGGGAIDLTKHVLDRDFPGAVAWLSAKFGEASATRSVVADAVETAATTVAAAVQTQPVFAFAPQSSPAARLVADTYLRKRGIALDVAFDHEQKTVRDSIITDRRGNIGFAMRDVSGAVLGLELKGTSSQPFTGLALGSSRDAAFIIKTRKQPSMPAYVYLVESAVEALSLYKLGKAVHGVIISTAGVRGNLPAVARAYIEQLGRVVVAYNNDLPGTKATHRLIQNIKGWFKGPVSVATPVKKDWNDVLTGSGPDVPGRYEDHIDALLHPRKKAVKRDDRGAGLGL